MKKKALSLSIIFLMIFMLFPARTFAAENQRAMYIFKSVLHVTNSESGHAYKPKYPDRKPIDIVGPTSGIDDAYAPFDCKVVATSPSNPEEGHMAGFESVNKVLLADGTTDYVTFMLAHDNNISDLSVGQTFKQGEVIYQEGTYGEAGGNHIHMEVARGSFSQNKGAYGGSIWKYVRSKENVMYAHQVFTLYSGTKILGYGGHSWIIGGEGNQSNPSKPTASISGQNVTVSWNPVSNASYYDVYLLTDPWGWEDIKYTGNTSDTSYTFSNVSPNSYCTFVIARPNADTAQSEWTEVIVQRSPSASLELDQTNITMQNGTCVKLNATTIPAGQKVSWSSTNPSVASIDSNGMVTAHKEGTTTINADMIYNGEVCFSFCTVKVTKSKEDVVPKITINKSRLEITDTTSDRLTAATTPGGQSVSWSSSDSKVAKVSNGVVTGVKAGTTTITASMRYNGITYSAKCNVTVAASKPADPPAPSPSDTTGSNGTYPGVSQKPSESDQNNGTSKPTVNSVSLPVDGASSITQTTARVDASCSYRGTRPSSVGLNLGTSKTRMSEWGSDNINHNKNPFDIWYNLDGLSAGTTYYYQFYAIVDGKTYTSETKSFTTKEEEVVTSISLPVSGASGITETTARVDASCAYTGTRPTSVGLYLGTSSSNLNYWKSDDNINHNKNPFNIWYNLNGLSAGTTYYYQFYAIADGKTYTSDIQSFTTEDAQPYVPPVNTRSGVVVNTNGQYLAINDGPAASPNHSNQIGRIPPGGYVTVYPDKTYGNWYWVEYGGVSGYAYGKYIALQ